MRLIDNIPARRKRGKKTLSKDELFLDRIAKIAAIGSWELDFATNEITWSAETYRIFGLPMDYRPAMDADMELVATEAKISMQAMIARAKAEGAGWDQELPLIRPSGERIWVRSAAMVVFDNDKPAGLNGIFQDISERVFERQNLQKANERIALATGSGRIGIWDWDVMNDRLYWDPWMYQLHGLEPHEGASTYEIWQRSLHPDDKARTRQKITDTVARGRPFDTEFRVIWPDASIHHIHATGHVTRNAAGQALHVIGVNWDVTEARRLTAELAEQHELLRVTLASIGEGVITIDSQGRITWLNPAAEHNTGWMTAEAARLPVNQVFRTVYLLNREPAENPVERCLAQGKAVGLASDIILIARDGREFEIEHSVSPIRNDQGAMLGAVLIFRDLTEHRRLAGELSHRASHDALTGLVNRAEFELRLRRLLLGAQEEKTENALLYIDLDQFKIVNDTCGHVAGDKLLRQFATLLSEMVRASDTIARLGGDEFAVILKSCPEAKALSLAQRICDRMEEFRFVYDQRRFRVGTSIGLVPVDERWTTATALLQAADAACYDAKEAGRNRVQIWSDADKSKHPRHGDSQWAARLAEALDEGRFVLFAQRIEALNGRPEGLHAEVLLRMREADGSLVPPGAFIPAAERFQFASRIDRWVLRNAIDWMNGLRSLDLISMISINLSGQSISDQAFHRWALDLLDKAGPQIRSRICLEITETAAVTNPIDAALFIGLVRSVGVRVALDDFGAGASSFGYLKTMPVDFLKIDGQFIKGLLTDPLDAVAVRCFADVAKAIGIKTIAEFVEDRDVLWHIRELGIDYAQGYLIHRPAPIEQLEPHDVYVNHAAVQVHI